MQYLKNVYLFKEMSDDELRKIAQAGTEKSYMAGQELFFSGQKADTFYVVINGTIQIYKSDASGEEHLLTRLSSGEHFGEMSFLTGDPRSASAQAVENSLVFEITYNKLQELLNQNVQMSERFHRALSRFLARRLRATTQELIQN
ncbi:MAG: cyclic nucleotide-binding domain-containing protein [Bdellovibrionaceae bacterium]|nr:cyclic nucleotide-binding domain-containing protein [Pseudobdellovibrionaceae bacterium]MDW8191044.1 cyclic nucleotide-binding domain-containing protein [Pseudobdellovibrionaceae bacterium]